MNIFFTSDHHFGHENIIKYCNRPFKSVDEMDEVLIQNWNKVVKKDDLVFHLGDFVYFGNFYKYFKRLNGRIFLIKGNHDKISESHFAEFYGYNAGYYETTINGKFLVLCHYAMVVWNRSIHGSWHLYGHSHGVLAESYSNKFDIGVDTHNYFPWSFEEVKQKMEEKEQEDDGI